MLARRQAPSPRPMSPLSGRFEKNQSFSRRTGRDDRPEHDRRETLLASCTHAPIGADTSGGWRSHRPPRRRRQNSYRAPDVAAAGRPLHLHAVRLQREHRPTTTAERWRKRERAQAPGKRAGVKMHRGKKITCRGRLGDRRFSAGGGSGSPSSTHRAALFPLHALIGSASTTIRRGTTQASCTRAPIAGL